MSISAMLEESLLWYVRAINHVDGKLEILFGSYGENDAQFKLTLSVVLGENVGYLTAYDGKITHTEPFSFEHLTHAAVMYAKLEILEFNKRRIAGLKDLVVNEFNCRDRMLFGWGEYLW